MGFIHIPVYFSDSDEDEEKMANLGLKANTTKGELVINTALICAYNVMDDGGLMIRLSNGDCVSTSVDIEYFENILSEMEIILDIPKLSPN